MNLRKSLGMAVKVSREEQERRKTFELAMGRIFRLGSRPTRPGDVEDYERARATIMSMAGEPKPDYRPNYARDRRKGAKGD